MDQTLPRRSHFARKIAILAFCLLVAAGSGLYWFEWFDGGEIKEDPQNAVATKALKESGAKVWNVVEAHLGVSPLEYVAEWLPMAALEPFLRYRMLPHVTLEEGQVNDANLAHLRNIRGLFSLTISSAALTDDWIDFIAERRVTDSTRVDLHDVTVQSDRGREVLAEVEKEQRWMATASRPRDSSQQE